MGSKEKTTWLSFAAVLKNILGNKKGENSPGLVVRMFKAFCYLGCETGIKLQFIKRQVSWSR